MSSTVLAPLRTVTRNLPSFVRDSIVAVIGQQCYTSLVWNVDVSDTECLKYSLSKALGLGLVVGGGIVKVPQIIKILRSGSARGLSLTSYLLDTASLLIVVAYNARQRFPFSTYGENAFLIVQNVVIVLLIFAFSHTPSKALKSLAFLGATGAASYALFSNDIVNLDLLRTLLAASIPLSLSSKLPQIAKIFSSGTTGQLSAFLVFNSLAGCLARVFTTATETGDRTLWWSFVSASFLNAILALQMLYYWNDSKPTSHRQVADRISEKVAARNAIEEKKQQQQQQQDNSPLQQSAVPVIIPAGATPAKPVGSASIASPRPSSRSATRATSARYTRKVD